MGTGYYWPAASFGWQEKEGVMPKRIQRKREKGWKLPENAKIVTRPTRWGNPFPIGRRVRVVLKNTEEHSVFMHRETSLELYRAWLYDHSREWLDNCVESLKGYDLACWCDLTSKCHADFLLEYVNRENSA